MFSLTYIGITKLSIVYGYMICRKKQKKIGLPFFPSKNNGRTAQLFYFGRRWRDGDNFLVICKTVCQKYEQ